MQFRYVHVYQEAETAFLTLADPDKRNAMTVAMGEELSRACRTLASRDDIRAVIVTGEGSAFSAGGDLDFILETRSLPLHERKTRMLPFYHLYLSILELPVPVIAAINGPAIGAGACFAIACDLRVASSRARLGFTFVRLALHPGMGATHFLPRLVGPARAADLLYSGRIVTADTALEMGLVNAVHPPDSLLAESRSLAGEIAACGPLAVRRLKASLNAGRDKDLAAALEREAEAQARDYGTADLLEGVRAVREKRRPIFSGR